MRGASSKLSPDPVLKRLKATVELYRSTYDCDPCDKHLSVIKDLAGNPLVTPLEIVLCCKNIRK